MMRFLTFTSLSALLFVAVRIYLFVARKKQFSLCHCRSKERAWFFSSLAYISILLVPLLMLPLVPTHAYTALAIIPCISCHSCFVSSPHRPNSVSPEETAERKALAPTFKTCKTKLRKEAALPLVVLLMVWQD
jgi:hypothetical protein